MHMPRLQGSFVNGRKLKAVCWLIAAIVVAINIYLIVSTAHTVDMTYTGSREPDGEVSLRKLHACNHVTCM